jgi:hypothetical protein
MKSLEKIYYSPKGYWRGVSAIKKLAAAAKVDEETAKNWLKKQVIWQIYLPAPKYVPRPKFDVTTPNEVHQADLLFLPHDTVTKRKSRKIYKYALTVVDIASRFKEAEPLSSKNSEEVAKAFTTIYSRHQGLVWPKLLQVDPGREFMGAVNKLMKSKNVGIKRGETGLHRAQGIVERFNRTLAERLFGHQYAQEILLEARGDNARSVEWVSRLPGVVKAINNETTRLIGMKPVEAIKLKEVVASPSQPSREEEHLLMPDVRVRYLYQPGELEGGERKRATDPVWSLDAYQIKQVIGKKPIVYYLTGVAPTGAASMQGTAQQPPKRGFVRQELLVIPPDTQLPPEGIL